MAGGAVVQGGSGGNPLRNGFITRPFLWAFILVTSLFFLWGFAYGLLGELPDGVERARLTTFADVLNKHFQNILHITKLQSTGLQVAYCECKECAQRPWLICLFSRYRLLCLLSRCRRGHEAIRLQEDDHHGSCSLRSRCHPLLARRQGLVDF